jgi:DNA primase
MARIPEETIEQIAAANDIVEVIGGYFPLKRAGATFKALCPFHQERSPSFTVNPQRQIFKCFGCGAGGSVFRFVMDYEHVDFGTAARRLAERAGIRIIEQELSPEDDARLTLRRRLLALHAEAAEWFHTQLLRTQGAQIAREYLKSRGITAEVAKGWKLGYAPDAFEAFAQFAHGRGFSAKEIVESGLVKLRDEEPAKREAQIAGGQFYDRFRGRVMFPICNDTGEVIAFSGRVLEADAKAAKYINSPETMLFTKGAVLFGLHRTKRPLIEKKAAIVCEGQLDLITAFESGVQHVIAPQGTAFTARQARILKRYVEEVVLCFDADAAGQKAAERSLSSLLAESLAVRVAEMPPGEDPDSLIRGHGAAAFLERVQGAKDFFEFQLDRAARQPEFNTPRGRAGAARRLAGWISLIADPLFREAVLNKSATRLEISPVEFARLLQSAPQPDTHDAGTDEASSPAAPPTVLDPTLRLLALTVLHSEEARKWVLAAPWRDLLLPEPDAALVVKILESTLRIEEPASMNVFLATLDATDEAAVSGLLEEKAPAHPVNIASDCWNELVRRQIRRRIESLQARLRAPELPSDDALKLQKEILDHQKRLLQIARPLSPPL